MGLFSSIFGGGGSTTSTTTSETNVTVEPITNIDIPLDQLAEAINNASLLELGGKEAELQQEAEFKRADLQQQQIFKEAELKQYQALIGVGVVGLFLYLLKNKKGI